MSPKPCPPANACGHSCFWVCPPSWGASSSSIETEAKAHPNQRIAIGDMASPLASKSSQMGFVAGMDTPLVRQFLCGCEQSARYAAHKAEVISAMTGTTGQGIMQAAEDVQPGITALGLKEGAIDYAMDAHNARLVPPEMKQKVEAAKAAIIAGRTQVIDDTAANACR